MVGRGAASGAVFASLGCSEWPPKSTRGSPSNFCRGPGDFKVSKTFQVSVDRERVSNLIPDFVISRVAVHRRSFPSQTTCLGLRSFAKHHASRKRFEVWSAA